jgi:hypothetical protein
MTRLARIHLFLILATATLVAGVAWQFGLCPRFLLGVQRTLLTPAMRLAEIFSIGSTTHRPAPLTFYLSLAVILAIYVVFDRELTRLAQRYGRAA